MNTKSTTDEVLEKGMIRELTIIKDPETNRKEAITLLRGLIKDFNAGKPVEYKIESNIIGDSIRNRSFPKSRFKYERFISKGDLTGDMSLYESDSQYLKADKELVAILTISKILSEIRDMKPGEEITLPKYNIYEALDTINISKIASAIKVTEEEGKLFSQLFTKEIESLKGSQKMNVRTEDEIKNSGIDPEQWDKMLATFDEKIVYIQSIQEKFMAALSTDINALDTLQVHSVIKNPESYKENFPNASFKDAQAHMISTVTMVKNPEKNKIAVIELLNEVIERYNSKKNIQFQIKGNSKSTYSTHYKEIPITDSKEGKIDLKLHATRSNSILDGYEKPQDITALLTICILLKKMKESPKEKYILPGIHIYQGFELLNLGQIASKIKVQTEEELKQFDDFFQLKINHLNELLKTENYRDTRETKLMIEEQKQLFMSKLDTSALLKDKKETVVENSSENLTVTSVIKPKIEEKPIVSEPIKVSAKIEPEVPSKVKSIRERFLGAIFKKKDMSV